MSLGDTETLMSRCHLVDGQAMLDGHSQTDPKLYFDRNPKKTKHIPKNHHQFSPIFRNLCHRFLFETSAAATAQEGRILQLIAIATHPEVSKMGIGYELRSFASGAPRSSRL